MRQATPVAWRVVRILLVTYIAIRLFWLLGALGGRTTEIVSVEAGAVALTLRWTRRDA